MNFERKFYLDKLIQSRFNGMIKIVTGIRRVGKSYLLFNLFKRYLLDSGVKDSHIISLQLDDIQNESLCNPKECYEYVRKHISARGQYYLLLDEIQLMKNFTGVLNSFLHISNLDVYVTGSNSRFLSRDVATEFRGRGSEIHLWPLTFKEVYDVKGNNFDECWLDYWTYGGMPMVQNTSVDGKIEYLQNIFRTTYLRDLIERNKINNEAEFGELIDVVASSVGGLTNPNKLALTFKSKKNISLSAPTIKRYLDYLEDAFIVEAAKRYDVKGKRYIATPLKYYYQDVGLRNSRLGMRQLEENHIMENVVYNELRQRGYQVDVGMVEVLEPKDGGYSQKQTEVDFVVNCGYERKYIQVVYGFGSEEKFAQELRPLKAIGDSFEKIVICRNNVVPHRNENGFTILSLKDFLLQP